MAENDTAVINAAIGYVYTGPVGTAAPTPATIKTLNPETYGSQTQTLKITGAPTGGTFTVTVGAATSAAIAYNASNAAVKAAISALATVGVGNVLVTGVGLSDTNGIDVNWYNAKQGTTAAITATASFTGGTTPAIAVTLKQAAANWTSVGHTSRGKLPEFGFDGGNSEMKGSWQKKKLRELQKDDPVDHLTVILHQFDTNALGLYYGPNASTDAGVFGVKSGTSPSEVAGLVIIQDGATNLGFHFSRSSVKRDEKIDLPVDDIAALGVKFTFLDYSDELLFSWISSDLLS